MIDLFFFDICNFLIFKIWGEREGREAVVVGWINTKIPEIACSDFAGLSFATVPLLRCEIEWPKLCH